MVNLNYNALKDDEEAKIQLAEVNEAEKTIEDEDKKEEAEF